MRASFAFLALPLLLVAGCGGKSDGGNTTPAAKVAATPPPAGQQWSDVVSTTPEGGYRMGNPKAPITLIEYGSRTCPHCAAFDQEGLPELKKDFVDTGKVSYEFRDFPVHAGLDMAPILLGRCVDPQSYFPMLDAMMANQQDFMAKLSGIDQKQAQGMSPSQITVYLAQQLGYLDFVKARGVPQDKAMACLTDKRAIDGVASRTAAANQQYDISGTPTFILNGSKLPQSDDEWPELRSQLVAAGA
jgi:protein-disulfide isomerase